MLATTLTVCNRPAPAREVTVRGARFLVVPVVMVVPGVLNGSSGPLLYRAAELAESVPLWNNRPIVIGHPTRDGHYISYRDSDAVPVGRVRRPSVDGRGRLRGEAWLSVARLKEQAPAVLAALKAGKRVEVSTGLHVHPVPAGPGATLNGREYVAVATRHRPDHLAILVGERGACSVADGCGLGVTNCRCGACRKGRAMVSTRVRVTNAGEEFEIDWPLLAKALGVTADPKKDFAAYWRGLQEASAWLSSVTGGGAPPPIPAEEEVPEGEEFEANRWRLRLPDDSDDAPPPQQTMEEIVQECASPGLLAYLRGEPKPRRGA